MDEHKEQNRAVGQRIFEGLASLPNVGREGVDSMREDIEAVVLGHAAIRRKVEELGGPGEWASDKVIDGLKGG